MNTYSWILIALISVASLALIGLTLRRISRNRVQIRPESVSSGISPMEIWDLYDQNRQPLHQTHNRQDRMASGTYHVVVQIWTVNSRRELLLTLRHPEKPFGHYWECTGGSVLAGESSQAGAVRELLEETGIRVGENELHLLKTTREAAVFIDNYAVCKNITLAELTLQPGETVDAQWVTLEKLDQLLAAGKIADPIRQRLSGLRPALESFMQEQAGQP